MKPELKQRLAIGAASLTILLSCGWIYFSQSRDHQHNVALHRHIGRVLAEQAAAAVGKKGRIVLIGIDGSDWPELKSQIEACKAELKKLGHYELREYALDTKDQPKYGVGSGLSGRRYLRIVKKNPQADLFVSFVGAPKLSAEERAELGTKVRLIAESRSGDNLPELFDHRLVQAAVVSRFQFPAPGPEKPRTGEEWFLKRYQVLCPSNAGALPKEHSE